MTRRRCQASFIFAIFILSFLFLSGCVTGILRPIEPNTSIFPVNSTVYYKGDIISPDAIVFDKEGGLEMLSGYDWIKASSSETGTLINIALSQGYIPEAMVVNNRGQESQEGIFASKTVLLPDSEIIYELVAKPEKGTFWIDETDYYDDDRFGAGHDGY